VLFTTELNSLPTACSINCVWPSTSVGKTCRPFWPTKADDKPTAILGAYAVWNNSSVITSDHPFPPVATNSPKSLSKTLVASNSWQVGERATSLIDLYRCPRVSAVVPSRQVDNGIRDLTECVDGAEPGPAAVICRRPGPKVVRLVEDSEVRKVVKHRSVNVARAES
jgi:hypothetical protein